MRYVSDTQLDVNSSQFYPPSNQRSSIRLPSFISDALIWLNNQLPNLDPKDLLPLGIHVQTGAIILGNASTPSLLVAEFQDAYGTYGVVPVSDVFVSPIHQIIAILFKSRSIYDLYKQVLNLRFQAARVRLVENDDFVDSMNTIGGIVHSRVKA